MSAHIAVETTAVRPRNASRVPPMSERLWRLDWAEHLPRTLDGDVTVHLSDIDRALPFIRDHYTSIFEDQGENRFYQEPPTEQKLRFYREADVFEFRDGDRRIGLFMGNPVDWSTYYVRSAGVFDRYQGRGLVTHWFARVLEILKSVGVARVETATQPGNVRSLRMMTRIGFRAAGMINSERWGAMLQLVAHLEEDAASVFLRQFCTGVRHERQHGNAESMSCREGSTS